MQSKTCKVSMDKLVAGVSDQGLVQGQLFAGLKERKIDSLAGLVV